MRGRNKIDLEIAKDALDRLEVDETGLDEMDKKILSTVIDFYKGGPVGVGAIAAVVKEPEQLRKFMNRSCSKKAI